MNRTRLQSSAFGSLQGTTSESTREDRAYTGTSGASQRSAGEQVEEPEAGKTGYQHGKPDGADAMNAAALRGEPAMVEGEREVRVETTAHAPLRGAESPAEAELYSERAPGETCEDGWDYVSGQIGTVDQPSRVIVLEEALFVDGGPRVEDIVQGGIGDCYLMAALVGLVRADPTRITGMMAQSGRMVTVSFFRRDPLLRAWVPAPVTVSMDLAQRTDGQGGSEGLAGANVRLSETPIESEWWASVEEDKLRVSEDAHHEAALWVGVMEKAYARYAEKWGQYGGASEEYENAAVDEQGGQRGGYEIIESGLAQTVTQVLMGDGVAVERSAETALPRSPGLGEQKDRMKIIKSLLRATGRGASITASTTGEDAVMRLDLEWTRSQAALRTSDAERGLGAALEGFRGAAPPDKAAAVATVAAAARELVRTPPSRSTEERQADPAVNELLLIVANTGSDSTDGARHTYADHSYSILDSTFRDKNGTVLALTEANVEAAWELIDTENTTVRLRNPHGKNSPDPNGTQSAEDDGVFELTLAQTLRAFTKIQAAVFR